jgi:hypothetical protein
LGANTLAVISDPDTDWIQIHLTQLMRMLAGRTLWSPKMEKLRNFMFKELSGWLGALSGAWASF